LKRSSLRQGEHGVRPYNICVGANSSCDRMCYMTFAHASTANGPQIFLDTISQLPGYALDTPAPANSV
jgi:hypothetical protein